MIIKLVRNGLGYFIVCLNAVFRPASIKRSSDEQVSVDAACQDLALYQFANCPFCVKVRRTMTRLSLTIELLNVNQNKTHRQTLNDEGGKVKVPCLRIQESGSVRYMYESNDIISYLERKFGVKND